MNLSRRVLVTIAFAGLVVLIFPHTAYGSIPPSANRVLVPVGYIDPGTGSIMIQVLIGAIAGGLALVGLYWKKLKSFIRSQFARRRKNDDKE